MILVFARKRLEKCFEIHTACTAAACLLMLILLCIDYRIAGIL